MGMTMPAGSLPLAIAVFRAWEATNTVAQIAGRICSVPLNRRWERLETTTEKFGWADTEFDPTNVSVTTRWRSIWANPRGPKIVFADTESEQIVSTHLWQPFELGWPFDQNTVLELDRKRQSVWADVSSGFQSRLLSGELAAVGRPKSVLAEPLTVPAGAWRELEVLDWHLGTASGQDGEMLHDLHILCDVPRPQPVPVATKVELAKNAIELAFPDGIPQGLSVDGILFEAAKFWPPKYPSGESRLVRLRPLAMLRA